METKQKLQQAADTPQEATAHRVNQLEHRLSVLEGRFSHLEAVLNRVMENLCRTTETLRQVAAQQQYQRAVLTVEAVETLTNASKRMAESAGRPWNELTGCKFW